MSTDFKKEITVALFRTLINKPLIKDNSGIFVDRYVIEDTDVEVSVVTGCMDNVGIYGEGNLSSISCESKKTNIFNNFIPGILLDEHLNDKGKEFFKEYYKPELDKIKKEILKKISDLDEKLLEENKKLDELQKLY